MHPGSLYPTEGDRLRQVVNIIRARARFIELYKDILFKYFRDQGKRTASSLKQLLSTRQNDPGIIQSIFQSNGEEELLVEAVKEIQFNLVSEFGVDALAQLKKSGVIFDINRPGLSNFLGNDLANRSQLINETSSKLMQRAMNAGLAEGEGAQKLAARIADATNDYSGYRSLRVARTEVNRASTLATEEGYKQGDVAKNEWISARDGSVRDTHVDLDGQAVDMGANFTSFSGASGPGPGLLGDAAEDINCRCTIAPIVESEL